MCKSRRLNFNEPELFSPYSLPFGEFATSEAIQCTEIYEYAQTLGNPLFKVVNFQPYKLIYAARLAECGMCEQVS